MDTKLMRLCRHAIEYLFYLFIFLLPWQTKLILRSADNNFNEIAVYATHVLLLVILILFFVHKLRTRSGQEKISALWISLCGLEVFVLISFFFAPDQVLAFFHYVLFLVGVGLFYLLREGIRPAAYDEKGLNRATIIYSFLAGIFFQAALGIYQFLSQSAFACKYLGLAAHHADILGTAVVETTSGRWLRAYGGFDHPNIFGGVLAISMIIAAYLLAKKKIIASAREISESIFLFVFYFVSLFALFFTFSRSAWLALVFGLLVLLVVLIIQKDRWIIDRLLALIFFSAVMLFVVAMPYKELVRVRIVGETRLEEKSLSERREYLSQSFTLIKEKPVFGVGFGNYSRALEVRDEIKKESWAYQPVHNVFLLFWAESGIMALMFFLGFLFLAVKKRRNLVVPGAVFGALLVLMVFDHWLLSLPFGLIFLFLILGLL
ncbi:MAG: O-antigen ligase family protein [Patescibacteria group bacterium]